MSVIDGILEQRFDRPEASQFIDHLFDELVQLLRIDGQAFSGDVFRNEAVNFITQAHPGSSSRFAID